MKKEIFNKLTVIAVLVLMVVIISIKIHSIVSFPEINDWNYYRLQEIDKKKDEFSFAVFGDNKNSITTFKSLISELNKEDIIFAIDLGDLVYDGEKEKFRFFIKQIKSLNKPLLTAIGNHELKEGGRANYYEIFGKFYYSFSVGKSYFIILDNANENYLNPWQMCWLKEELQKSQKYKYRFVFMHVPLYDPRKDKYKVEHGFKNLSLAKKLNGLFDKYNITMLFASHIHGYYKGIWGKTPYIITGGAGAELTGSDPEHYFYHYVKVNVSDNGLKYKVIKLKNPGFELMDRWIHDAWIYIYAFFAIHFLDLMIVLTLIYLGFYIIFVKKWLIWGAGKINK